LIVKERDAIQRKFVELETVYQRQSVAIQRLSEFTRQVEMVVLCFTKCEFVAPICTAKPIPVILAEKLFIFYSVQPIFCIRMS
jgi:hypothetical protein